MIIKEHIGHINSKIVNSEKEFRLLEIDLGHQKDKTENFKIG